MKTASEDLVLPKIPKGEERQWVRCRQCRRVSFYDYLPRSLSRPIRTAPCHHDMDLQAGISEEVALKALKKIYKRVLVEA